jgi:hypothetical protein
MLGFENFRCVRILLGGIELTHVIAKAKWKMAASARFPLNNSIPCWHK